MTSTTACPRCSEPISPGIRTCARCGFDVAWDQAVMTTVKVTPGAQEQVPSPLIEVLRQATVGEYEIIAELGRGGMATVFLAHEVSLGRKVAIKVIPPAMVHGHGPDLVERFRREARTAGALSHPHIIPIFAVRESGDVLFFVMKYVPGRALDSVIREVGPLPIPMAAAILTEAGGALDYAHRQGVVHRDVKPGNIMVDEEGFAVITDFGIARAAEDMGLTQTGTTVGTPAYLSPETCSGAAAAGPASDQYALGVVAYQLIAGRLPFLAESGMGMMYAQIHTPPTPLKELRADCPEPLASAVMRMLEKKPEDRWPSLKEATAAIAEVTQVDDAVRGQIGALAKNRPERVTVEQFVAAQSPVPARPSTPSPTPVPPKASGPEPVQSAPPVSETPTRHSIRVRAFVWGVLGAVAVGVVSFYWSSRSKAGSGDGSAGSALSPATAVLSSDSLLLSASGAADYARQRAVAAGATALDLAGGDSVRQQAEADAAQGKKAEAAVLFTSAAGLWTGAEHAAVARAIATKPEPPRAPTPPPRRPAEPSDSEAVLAFYHELERAIEARQLGEVRRLLPNLTQSEERAWRKLFAAADVSAIDATYFVDQLIVDGQTARAHVVSDLSVTKDGKTDSKQRTEAVVLSKGPQGWRQIRVE